MDPIDEAVQITRDHLAETYKYERPVLRCQHAKGFAARGRLLVYDVSKGLRHGVFAEPDDYPIVVRFSNNSLRVQADKVPAARGLAIKVFEVQDGADERTWDLILVSGRAFFAQTPEECVPFAKAMAADRLKDYFFPSFRNPKTWRLRGFYNAWRATHSGIVDPLDGTYDSFLPFALGPHIIRYIVKPLHQLGSNRPASKGPDFLREAVQLRLAVGSASLGLYVQQAPRDMELDPLLPWPRAWSRPMLVGSLELPVQQLMPDAEAEVLEFNPSNAPGEHKPLGPINELRRRVYEESARFRREANA